MQLLPHGRVLLLSDEQLTIHNMPTFSVAAALDALSPFNVDALWSLDLIHGPTLDPISNLWMFEDFPSDPDTSCILCIIAPAFRCTVRVPLSHASHLEVKHALFRKPTFEGGTDIAFYRGVVKVNSSGLISFVENLDNWVHVEDGVTSIRGLNTFDYPITSGVAPVDVTQTTFDQGSGRVCVLNRFSNDLEVLDFV